MPPPTLCTLGGLQPWVLNRHVALLPCDNHPIQHARSSATAPYCSRIMPAALPACCCPAQLLCHADHAATNRLHPHATKACTSSMHVLRCMQRRIMRTPACPGTHPQAHSTAALLDSLHGVFYLEQTALRAPRRDVRVILRGSCVGAGRSRVELGPGIACAPRHARDK